MKNSLCKTLILALLVGLVVCALPGAALAAGGVIGQSGVYDTLADAFAANETAVQVVSDAPGCDIPSGVAVSVETGATLRMADCTNSGALNVDGVVSGNFSNKGTVQNPGNCDTIYDYTQTLAGANILYPFPNAITNVSEVIYTDNTREAAVYHASALWIPAGKSVAYFIINHYVCTPDGARLAYAISYRYNNAKQTAMSLDAQKYPAVYCVMDTPQVIPAPPDTEVDYVFTGWYCKALGYDENALQKTLTIPAGTVGDLTLISWWTSSPGHNAKNASATTGMASGAAKGGVSGTMTAAANLLTANSDDDDDDDETAANILTGTTGGMRVRTANATSRHTFTEAQTSDDIEALAASRRSLRQFPWQWVGVSLGGAVILFAVGMTVRRKLTERNAATLEKLNIHD